MSVNIPLTETWTHNNWQNWSVNQAYSDGVSLGQNSTDAAPYGLVTQKHINVYEFVDTEWTNVTGSGVMTIGPQPTLNYWNALTIQAFGADTNGFTSLGFLVPVDLTALGSDAYFSIALPSFPLADVDLANSYVYLADGSVPTSHSRTLNFNAATNAPIAGNTYLSWPYSALVGDGTLNLADIVAFGLYVVTTGACTVTVAAPRLLANDWIATNVDFNNRLNQLQQTIPLNGNVSATPVSLPVVWRSAQVAGPDDPRPLDAEMTALIYTGQATQPSSVSIFMRGTDQVFATQLDLEAYTQDQLEEATTGQPLFTMAPKAIRTVGELESLGMGQLDAQTMYGLETTASPVNQNYVQFTLSWGASDLISISSAGNPNPYQFTDVSLSAQTWYLLSCKLEGFNARVVIYSLDGNMAITGIVYDTGEIPDDGQFPRYQGRIGLQANLQQDAVVSDIRPSRLVFAEYRSASLASLTPVVGAQLFVTQSPDMELWQAWEAWSDNAGNEPILTIDSAHSLSGASTAVQIGPVAIEPPGIGQQGIVSNVLTLSDPDEASEASELFDQDDDPYTGIIDFNETQITFDVWIPDTAFTVDQPITFGLMNVTTNGTAFVPLQVPQLLADEWQHMEILPPYSSLPLRPGLWQFVAFWNGPANVTWWIDNVSVTERAITWSARSIGDDPWQSSDDPWIDFHDLINAPTSGVCFRPAGKQLQVRARSLRQDAFISGSVKIVPKYAELGRLVWPEDVEQFTTVRVSSSQTNHPASGTDDSTIGAVAWVNPGRVTAHDSSYATATFASQQTSHYLYASQFGFSLPSDAIIKGIQATVFRKGTKLSLGVPGGGPGGGGGAVNDTNVWHVADTAIRLVKNIAGVGTIQSPNKSKGYNWPTSASTQTFGSSSDLWNNQWTAANINPSGGDPFGIVIACRPSAAAPPSNLVASVDYVKIQIWYVEPVLFLDDTLQLPTAVPIITNTSGRTFTFDGSGSVGNDGIGTWLWDFGDETTNSGRFVTHTYVNPGIYYATLTVTDRYGFVDLATNEVDVT